MKLFVLYQIGTLASHNLPKDLLKKSLEDLLSALVMSMVRALSNNHLKDALLCIDFRGLGFPLWSRIIDLIGHCPFHISLCDGFSDFGENFEHFLTLLRQCEEGDKIFIVQGGCLLDPEALSEMTGDYALMKAMTPEEIVLSPFDSLELYKKPIPSLVVAGHKRYWRTVGKLSKTLFMDQKAFLKLQKCFNDELGIVTEMNPPIAVLSPMPSLAIDIFHNQNAPFVAIDHWLTQGDLSHPSLRRLHIPEGIT